MGVEQSDLALNLLRSNWLILYCPILECAEVVIRGQLCHKPGRILYLNTRNKLWIAWKHYPLFRAFRYVLTRNLAALLRSIRYGWLALFLSGFKDGLLAPKSIREKRHPLSDECWKVYDRIQSGWLVEPDKGSLK
jgi:hypothetical protein